LYVLKRYNIENYILMAVILTILDETDNVWTKWYRDNACTKTFYYQIQDKIMDAFSYLLFYAFFPSLHKTLFLPFLIYRIIGVVLMALTKNAVYLIIMPDFLKEYLLYLYVFKDDNTYLPTCFGLKMAFEVYYHTKVNQISY
jgi:hypothetical protein